MDKQSGLMELGIDELRRRARISFRLVQDIPAVLTDFARGVVDELRGGNRRGGPVRLILPVGPVAQYPILVELCRKEGISWRNVRAFQMDEWLDWQGRPVPVSHPLSLEGFLRREYSRAPIYRGRICMCRTLSVPTRSGGG